MQKRVDHHRSRRCVGWDTVERPYNLPEYLNDHATHTQPILIDCLTLWLSNALLAHHDLEARTQDLINALRGMSAPVVAVSNEVGMGIVPENALARKFRDAQGRLNARMAEASDRAVLVAAGLPLVLKNRKEG